MKTLYFDCFAGASGDMILGALVDAGADQRELLDQLRLLKVSGYEVSFGRENRAGLSATRAYVHAPETRVHRHLSDVVKIIRGSALDDEVRNLAVQIFTRLAEAEAVVHNISVERVHFHEVGALDAIIDVVGACVGFKLLGIGRFVSSPLHLGSGTVEMAHGRFPVPPPAVALLLRDAPVYATDVPGELVTPTGAAIISTVCDQYGPLPPMRLVSTGYGAGSRDLGRFPNALRILVGEAGAEDRSLESLVMIESNIDDMSPQIFGHVMSRAFELGALDCFFTPVQMKKNRPGVLLSILCNDANRDALCEMVFAETTTLGVRFSDVTRRSLRREILRVETRYGPIDVKRAALGGGSLRVTPEYEQCLSAARTAGVSLLEVEDAARRAAQRVTTRDRGAGEE